MGQSPEHREHSKLGILFSYSFQYVANKWLWPSNIHFNLTYLAVTVLAFATTAPAKTQVK